MGGGGDCEWEKIWETQLMQLELEEPKSFNHYIQGTKNAIKLLFYAFL